MTKREQFVFYRRYEALLLICSWWDTGHTKYAQFAAARNNANKATLKNMGKSESTIIYETNKTKHDKIAYTFQPLI